MKTIVMDTSNSYLVVALYENDICLQCVQEIGNKKQSEYAILHLQQILNACNLTMLDIDEMVITHGPGSYTGVRVAMTIAKTIAVTTKINIKVVSSLMAYAGFKKAISVLDARSKKIFVGVYEDGKVVVEEKILDIVDFKELESRYPGYDIVGNGQIVNRDTCEVDLAKNMYQLSRNIEPLKNVEVVVPHYIKPVEAKKLC